MTYILHQVLAARYRSHSGSQWSSEAVQSCEEKTERLHLEESKRMAHLHDQSQRLVYLLKNFCRQIDKIYGVDVWRQPEHHLGVPFHLSNVQDTDVWRS